MRDTSLMRQECSSLEQEWGGCGAQGEAAGEVSEQHFLVFYAKAALMV